MTQPAPATILIVEDDRPTAQTIQRLLEEEGYRVELAADGAAGLARAEAGDIDLVLLDLRLPRLDGLEVCRRLRERAADVYLPIIIMTSAVNRAQRQAGFAAGADDYVTKPLDFEDFLARVEVWVRTRQRLSAAHNQRQQDEAVKTELAHRARTFRALHELAVATAGSSEPAALAQAIVRHARDLLGADAACLFWWEAEHSLLRRLADTSNEGSGAPPICGPTEGMLGQAFQQRRAVVVESYPDWPHAVPAVVARGVQAAIAVPLQMGNRALGALLVYSYHRQRFSPVDAQCLVLLAAQVAPVLETAHLHTALAVSEAALRERDVRFRYMAESIPHIFWLTDPVSQEVLYLSPAYEVIWGRPRQAILENPWSLLDGIHPDDRERMAAVFAEQPTVGYGREEEFRIVRPDGSVRWLWDRVYSVPDEQRGRYLLAGVTVDVTARKEAELALAERTQRLEALQAITLEITREHNLDALLSHILRRAIALLGATGGAIYLWEAAHEALIPRAEQGLHAGPLPPLRLGEGLTGQVAAGREGMIVNEYPTWAGAARRIPGWAQSVMAEPILYQDQLVGVITVGHQGGRGNFTTQEQTALHSFAAQAAVAIENARLYERLHQRLARLQTLTELNQLISATLDQDTVLQAIAEAAATLMDAPIATFWRVDAARGHLHRETTVVPEGMSPPLPTQRRIGEGMVGWTAKHRQVLNAPDVTVDPRAASGKWATSTGLRSCLCVPIEHDGALLAVLYLARRTPFSLDADDEVLLTSLRSQAAAAIRNAAVYATEVEVRTHFTQLFRGIPTPICITSLTEGRIVDANEAFCATMGYCREDLIGHTTLEREIWLDPADRARLVESLQEGRAVRAQPFRTRSREGEIHTILLTAEMIQIAGAPHILGVFQDVTEHQRALAEQARLQAAVERLEERERIAMDLHDGVIQSIYAAALALGAQEMALPRDTAPTREILRQTQAQLDATIETLRRYISTLRAPATPPCNLPEELERLVTERCVPAQVIPALALDDQAVRTLPAEVGRHLLQLAHEAISNAIRHGGASRVQISLQRAADGLALTIADDGRGFDPDAVPESAEHGLCNMAARAAQLGGQLSIVSAPGQGTEVRLTVPAPEGTS
jgi:PAS domain S-box-containing protein